MPFDDRSHSRNLPRMLAGYLAMILATIGLFLLVRGYGEGLTAPVPLAVPAGAAAAVPAAGVAHPLVHLLIALAAVIVVGRLLAWLFAYLAQPPVIGEVLAGICLGPSLLGRIWPEASAFLLPPSLTPSLAIVAQLGVIFYMFLVGLELNANLLRKQGHVTLAISHASIVVPFSLGALLAIWLYPQLSNSEVKFTAFALFMSVAMSITAFPVLARILTDRQLSKTDLGVMALACAATDDVSAWCLLALVVGVAQSQVAEALSVAVMTVAYIVVVFFVIRPLVARYLERPGRDELNPASLAIVLVGVLASAAATEAIGIHAIFGAFLFGAVIPHDSRIAQALHDKLSSFVVTLLLPAFFALTGMRTEIGLVSGWQHWLICLAIIAVATIGKFGGTLAAARVMGLNWRDASSLGILMNTRGLMELIVLNIGLDLQVISPTLFAMMVLMAIVTTMATSPVLAALVPRREPYALPEGAQVAP